MPTILEFSEDRNSPYAKNMFEFGPRVNYLFQKVGVVKLFIGNAPFEMTAVELRELFENVGHVDDLKMITDRATGRSKGYAFISMPERQDALRAMKERDGHEVAGRPLRVQEARSQTDRPRR